MGIIDYRKDGGLHLVTMNSGQNTICPDWQQRMLEILDSVEGDCGQCAALVLTGVDKFFCNGLNLEKLMTLSPEEMELFGRRMADLLADQQGSLSCTRSSEDHDKNWRRNGGHG